MIKDNIFFLRKFSFLLRADMAPVEALNFLAEGSSKNVRKKIQESAKLVASGQPLSVAFSESLLFKESFSIELVSAGEKSGQLIRSLDYLSHSLEKQRTLRNQLISSLIYPVIIMFGTLVVTGSLVLFIFPKILPIFTSMNLNLPWTTRLLVSLVFIFQHYFIILILGVLLICGTIQYFWRHSEKLRSKVLVLFLKFPPTGNLWRTYFSVHFCRIFSLLLFAGLSVPDCLSCAKKMWRQGVCSQALADISQQVQKGRPLGSSLNLHKNIFPKLLVELVSSGEKSGNLASAFEYLSDYYESELANILKTLSVLIEPVLMIFLGLGIGFISMSLITPIYSLTEHINL